MILNKTNKYSSIYETSLKLFEVFVETIKNETDDDQRANDELQAVFDFVITISNNKNQDQDTTVKVSIDVLTIIFIHIVVKKENPLLNKLLKLNSFKIIMNLIQIDNLHIREHSIKILQLLIFVSPAFERIFREKQGYRILGEILKESEQHSSFNMCHTILNTILQTYDNPNDIRPVNNALV